MDVHKVLKAIIILEKVVRCTQTLLPKSFHHIFVQSILVVSQADPQFAGKRVAKQEQAARALPATGSESVQLDIRKSGMLVCGVEVAQQ